MKKERKRRVCVNETEESCVVAHVMSQLITKQRKFFVKFLNLPHQLNPEVYESIINPISYHMYLDLYHWCQ